MKAEEEKLLEENGWTVECESPLEMRHEDGSLATGQAIHLITEYYQTQEALKAVSVGQIMAELLCNDSAIGNAPFEPESKDEDAQNYDKFGNIWNDLSRPLRDELLGSLRTYLEAQIGKENVDE